MQFKIFMGFIGLWLGWSSLYGDVSEMIFYPEADFSEGVLHFNYQGEKNKNYGFMFDKGYDTERILYVRPDNYSLEKQPNGTVRLMFENTDRYSYMQRIVRDEFLVTKDNGVVKILLSGGDCVGSPGCVTAENILTVNVPNGYDVLKYQGLDQDLKPLKKPKWQRKGNIYTLIARDVKGASIVMELEKSKEGKSKAPIALASMPDEMSADVKPSVNAVSKPSPVSPVPAVNEASVQPDVKSLFAQVSDFKPVAPKSIAAPVIVPAASQPMAAASKPTVEKPVARIESPIPAVKPAVTAATVPPPAAAMVKPVVTPAIAKPELSAPAPYFRNFQLFQSRVVALSEAGKERLNEWADLFKSGSYKMVIINSYTDDIPPQRLKNLYATNEILSAARGQMVADYLVSIGMDPKMITVKGKGDADPVASNETEEGRSKNRRVEFVLTR